MASENLQSVGYGMALFVQSYVKWLVLVQYRRVKDGQADGHTTEEWQKKGGVSCNSAKFSNNALVGQTLS